MIALHSVNNQSQPYRQNSFASFDIEAVDAVLWAFVKHNL